jgi:hypothetical protein
MFFVTVICTLALVAYAQRLVLVAVRKLEQLRAQLAVYDTEAIRRHQAAAESSQQRQAALVERFDALLGARRVGLVLVLGAVRRADGDGGELVAQFITGARVQLAEQWRPGEPRTGEVSFGPMNFALEPGTMLMAIGPCVLEQIAVGIDMIGPFAVGTETPVAVVPRPIPIGGTIRARVRELAW